MIKHDKCAAFEELIINQQNKIEELEKKIKYLLEVIEQIRKLTSSL